MKKKVLAACVLSATILFSASACNQEEHTEEKNKDVKVEDKSQDGTQTVRKSQKNIDPDVREFTQKYLDVYDQEGNAFIEVLFRNRDFIPQKLWDRVNIVRLQEEGTEPYSYKMIISCDDDVLYRLDQMMQKPFITEEHKGSFYLSKGEFFIVEAAEEVLYLPWLRAYKVPDFYAETNVYFPELKERPQDIVIHDISIWGKGYKTPLLFNNEVYYGSSEYSITDKEGRLDLDGDGKEEYLYFWGERSTSADMEAVNARSKFLIDDIEFPVRNLFEENSRGEDLEGYSSDILAIEVIDIDPRDEYKEILLKKVLDIKGGMYYSQVYRYQDRELYYMGGFFSGREDRISDFVYPEEAAIKLPEYQYAFGFSYTTPAVYRIEGGKLVKKEYDEKKMEIFDKRLVLDVKEKINLYGSPDSNQVVTMLEKGDKAIFLETDNRSWIKLKSFHSEEEGYLFLRSDDQYQSVSYPNQENLNGKTMFDLFDDLPVWD